MDTPPKGSKAVEVTSEAVVSAVSSSLSRRRMLRRSLGVAAPAVFTLASDPVSACTCVQASTFASMSVSSRHPTQTTCAGGKSPSQWASDTTSWPAACKEAGTKDGTKRLSQCFGTESAVITYWHCGFSTSTALNTAATLKDACKSTNTVVAEIAAAYISACANPAMFINAKGDTVLTSTEARKAWRDISLNGAVYRPTGTSLVWDGNATRTWMASLR